MKMRSLAGLLRPKGTRANFETWKTANPFGSFKDYFAETTETQLKKGKSSVRLGANLRGGKFTEQGANFFRKLQNWGLTEDDICVDYGCGTLRVGLHVVDFLRPGAYWGFDISDFLLEEGRKLIGEELWAEKRPNLRVISPETVAEAATAKPTVLFSTAVLIHIHPDDLPEYVKNIMTLIGSSAGQAIVTGKWSDDETIQYSDISWAHAISVVQDLVQENAGEMEILREQEQPLESVGRTAKHGVIRIRNHAGLAR